jgi:hypothetical protein
MAVMLLSISSLSQANLVYEYRVDCHSDCGYYSDVSGVFTFYGDSPQEFNSIDGALDFTFIDNTSGAKWGQDDFRGDSGNIAFSEDRITMDAFMTVDDDGVRDYFTFRNSYGDYLVLRSGYCNVFNNGKNKDQCAGRALSFDDFGRPVSWMERDMLMEVHITLALGDGYNVNGSRGRWILRQHIERDDDDFLVNEPTALAIFVLGLIGISARRLKRQS